MKRYIHYSRKSLALTSHAESPSRVLWVDGVGEGCTIDDLIPSANRIHCSAFVAESTNIQVSLSSRNHIPRAEKRFDRTCERTIWGGKWRKNWSPLMSPNSNHPRLHCALQTFHYLIDCCQRFHKQKTKTQNIRSLI